MAEQMYTKCHTDENGNTIVDAYAYGEDWVAMALYMDDIGYPTPEEARGAWEGLKHDSTLHSE